MTPVRGAHLATQDASVGKSSDHKSVQPAPKNMKSDSESKKTNTPTKPQAKSTIPGLPLSMTKKKKKKKKGQADLTKADFLLNSEDQEGFVFSDTEESSDDDNRKGFFNKSPFEVEKEELLLASKIPFRSSKSIQKEELWNISLQKAGNTLKRSLTVSPGEDVRRIRSRSICYS